MKRLIVTMTLAIAVIWLTGCTQAMRKTTVPEQATMAGVFKETMDSAIETGSVDVVIEISIKTHQPGFYLLEPEKSLHGKPGYPFVVTIDGQTAVWREDGQVEATPQYDAQGILVPDGGEGRLYVLAKKLRMAQGIHRVEIELPEEGYASSVEVNLEEKSKPHLLKSVPVYRRSGTSRPSFLHGLSRFDVFLDGKHIGTGGA